MHRLRGQRKEKTTQAIVDRSFTNVQDSDAFNRLQESEAVSGGPPEVAGAIPSETIAVETIPTNRGS